MSMQLADLSFLIAEDNEFQRRWLMAMLTNLGARHILEAEEGRQALSILQNQKQHIDIVFVDLDMPKMDGMELIRHLSRENNPPSVVLASALAPSLVFSAQTMSKAYGINLLGAIEKPATPEALKTLLASHKSRADHSPLPLFSLSEIARGLEEGQFAPFFQPRVELGTGKLTGVEAFARWCHPQYGVLPPAAFMPILEQHNEVEAFDWFIVEKSVAACREWQKQGYRITVSINLSRLTLEKAGTAEKAMACVANAGVSADQVIFGVTESTTVTRISHFLENLVRMRMHGFGLSVHDYGTSNSNIGQLAQIPYSELKIDRSWVVRASESKSVEDMLRLSFDTCEKMQRKVVAVGIETRQEWDFLLKLGCDSVQGHYIAKPMESNMLPTWAEEWMQFF